jgi:hypothetical protein
MRRGVAGRRNRAHLGIAEHDHLTVGERKVIELDARALRQVGRGPGARDQLRQP